MTVRRRGDAEIPPVANAKARERTGSLRMWSDDPLKDGTPPGGNIDPTLANTLQITAPRAGTNELLDGPLEEEQPLQAEPPTDPQTVAIWDRSFVSEPKEPSSDELPVQSPPPFLVDTRQIELLHRQRRRRKRTLVAAFGLIVVVGAGTAVAVRTIAARDVSAELSRTVSRSSDTLAQNLETLETLDRLHREYADREDVLGALAAQNALYALRFDSNGAQANLTREIIARSDADPDAAKGLAVARAAEAILDGRPDAAEKLASRGLAGSDRSPELAYVRACARLALAATDAALSDLQWATKAEPSWSAPVALRAEAERLAGRLAEARATVDDLGRRAPDSTELRVARALVAVDAATAAGNSGALPEANRAVDAALGSIDSRARLPRARLLMGRARVLLADGAADRAFESLHSLEKQLGPSPELTRTLAEVQIARGQPLSALRALEAAPVRDTRASAFRIEALLQLERAEEALAALDAAGSAIAAPWANWVRGIVAYLELESDAAARDLSSARDELAVVTRIEALTETAEWTEVNAAVDSLQGGNARRCAQALRSMMWGNDARAREALGPSRQVGSACASRLDAALALAAGDADAAVGHLRRASSSGRPSDRVRLAEALWRQRGAAAALAEARSVLEMGPTSKRTLYRLADLFSAIGAPQDLSRLAALAPRGASGAALRARAARLSRNVGTDIGWSDAQQDPLYALERAHEALQRRDIETALTSSQAALAVPAPLLLEATTLRARTVTLSTGFEAAKDFVDGRIEEAVNGGNRRLVHGLRLLRARISIEQADSDSLRQAANHLSFLSANMQISSAEAQALAGDLKMVNGERTEAARLYRASLALDPTPEIVWRSLQRAAGSLTAEEQATRARVARP